MDTTTGIYTDPINDPAPSQGGGGTVLDTSAGDQLGAQQLAMQAFQAYLSNQITLLSQATWAALGYQIVNGALVPLPAKPDINLSDLCWYYLYDPNDFEAAAALYLLQYPVSTNWSIAAVTTWVSQNIPGGQFAGQVSIPGPSYVPPSLATIQGTTSTTASAPMTVTGVLSTLNNPLTLSNTNPESSTIYSPASTATVPPTVDLTASPVATTAPIASYVAMNTTPAAATASSSSTPAISTTGSSGGSSLLWIIVAIAVYLLTRKG